MSRPNRRDMEARLANGKAILLDASTRMAMDPERPFDPRKGARRSRPAGIGRGCGCLRSAPGRAAGLGGPAIDQERPAGAFNGEHLFADEVPGTPEWDRLIEKYSNPDLYSRNDADQGPRDDPQDEPKPPR